MTKLVTFHKPMRGVGNPALVPDEVARGLEERGEIVPNPPSFPPGAATATAAARPEVVKPMVPEPPRRFERPGRGRDRFGQTYQTK
jgi:hypothetical protein